MDHCLLFLQDIWKEKIVRDCWMQHCSSHWTKWMSKFNKSISILLIFQGNSANNLDVGLKSLIDIKLINELELYYLKGDSKRFKKGGTLIRYRICKSLWYVRYGSSALNRNRKISRGMRIGEMGLSSTRINNVSKKTVATISSMRKQPDAVEQQPELQLISTESRCSNHL